MLAGRAVMINWSDVAKQDRPAYYEWHSREHMVGRVGIPGFQRGRRSIAVRAQRDFLMLYEVDDLSVLTGAAYMAKANNPSALTRSTTKLISNSVRAMAKVELTLGIGQGGYLLTLRFDPGDAGEIELDRYLRETLPLISEMPGIVAAHFCVADKAASTLVPEERKGRPTYGRFHCSATKFRCRATRGTGKSSRKAPGSDFAPQRCRKIGAGMASTS